MEFNSGDSLSVLEESLIKMITDFSHSFGVLNKSDSQVMLWLDTLNSVVTNILDVYKICFLTRNNIFCQNVIESVDGLKKVIKTIVSKESKVDSNISEPERRIQFKILESDIYKNNLDTHLDKNMKLSSDLDPGRSDITFGDIDYECLMKDLKKDENCDNYFRSKKMEDCRSRKCFVDSYAQTELNILNFSFCKKIPTCSIGIQVENMKQINLNYSNSYFSSDYNLNDPYMCNQNFEDTFQNLHYYNDSCSYQSDIDRTYQDHVSNFSHQYQPLPCSTMSLPGRNISAPVFLPRLISPTPIHHNDHHHSSLPYAITMFSSSQSYLPGTFNPSISPPHHYLGVANHGHKESKRSHKKSDLLLVKKTRSSTSKSKDDSRNSQSKEQSLLPTDSSVHHKSSCIERIGYLAKIDLLEKACNYDVASCQYYFSRVDLTSSSDGQLEDTQTKNSTYIKDSSEAEYNIISDFQSNQEKINNVTSLNDSNEQSDFTATISEINVSCHKTDFSGNSVEFKESSNISVLNELLDNSSNVSKCTSSKNNVTIPNECISSNLSSFDSHINSAPSLSEALENVEPTLENNNNNIDESSTVSKKMDVKLSFVNVLTTGLKISSDTKICSVKKTSSMDNVNEIEYNKPHNMKPPNVFELSHFPSLKPSTQQSTNNPEQQVLYFGHCKPLLSSLFGPAESISKNDKSSCTYESRRPGYSASRLDEKQNFAKSKESESVKRSMGFVNKSFPLKKNISFSENRKNGESRSSKCGYQVVKHSNISSNSKYAKEEINSLHTSNQERKVDGSFNTMNKRCKPDDFIHSKKTALNKRKSVPGEDGWTIIPAKLRSGDCWNSKDFNKRTNDYSLLNDDIVNRNSEISEITQGSIKIDSSSKETTYPLTSQQAYFSSPVQLEQTSSFFKEKSSVLEDFDICRKINDNGFALTSLGIIDSVEDNKKIPDTTLDTTADSFSQSDYQVPSGSTLMHLSSTSDCSDGIHVPEVPNIDFLQLSCFLDQTNIHKDFTGIDDFNSKSIENLNQISLFENKMLYGDPFFFDDGKISKLPYYEESEIANFLSHSSSWSELKPDTDSYEQHLNEEDVRKSRELQEEALMLRNKIKALQLNDNEVDTENECDYENDNENIDPHEIFTEYSHYLSQISWGDQIDEMERFQEMLSSDPDDSIFKFQYGSIEQFREFVARHPGKALDLHYKLLGRSKRSNSDEQYEIRRKKAEEKRQRLLNRKAAKMRELLQRVEEVRQAQLQIIEERKCRIVFKLKKAEENRNLYLKTIQKKAHDEEEKLKEIAFINELEAQNRRHDSMALRQEQEERLQNIMEERQRKVDEKAAKEAAVGERKRVLEAERMEKIEKIQQKRREKEEHIGKKQQERELERLVIAREKAREREERLQARQAAQIANVEELQKKIKKKQENSARRHEENIQHIRQKAVETGMLRNIMSEDSNSDVSSKNSSTVEKKKMAHFSIYDIEQNVCPKNQRKKCRKIRSRLQKSGTQYIAQLRSAPDRNNGSIAFTTLKANIDFITKLIDTQERCSVSDIAKLDKHLLKMIIIIDKNLLECKSYFKLVNGFEVLQKTLVYLIDSEIFSISISYKCIEWICKILFKICENEISNIEYFISCSDTCSLLNGVNLLLSKLLCSKLETNLSVIQISALLLSFHEMVLRCCTSLSKENNLVPHSLLLQLKDIVSYLLYCGLLKKIGDVIKLTSLEPVECKVNEQLIEPIVYFVTRLVHPQYFWKEFEELLLMTDFLGTVSLLYSHLHQAQQILPPFTLSIIKFFKTLATEQCQLFQKVLGSEGISLQFRYIASFILQHCITSSRNSHLIELLNHTILVIGYFALKNSENQLILQSGQTPTVLQQLISLPLQYFCEPELKCVLFPTLIAICDGNSTNRELLENEMSYNHIESFLEDPVSKTAELMKVLYNLEDPS